MGEQIDEFPAKPKEQRTYPWDDWTNGKPWKLYRGFDFDVDVDQFRNRMFTHATRRGMKVNTSVQVHKRDGGTLQDGKAYAPWPDEVKAAVAGPETEVLFIRFYDPPAELESPNGAAA